MSPHEDTLNGWSDWTPWTHYLPSFDLTDSNYLYEKAQKSRPADPYSGVRDLLPPDTHPPSSTRFPS